MKSICIIPVFNEISKLPKLIKKIKKNKHKKYNLKYIFINNGSTDGSYEILKKNKLNIINLKKNYGIGYALIIGYEYALKYNYQYIIHLAGNGKMDPYEIPKLLNPMIYKKFKYVNGSRFLNNGSFKNNPIYRIILIKLFSIFLTILFNKKITDCSCGFRAFETNLFKNFKKNFKKKSLYTYGYEYFSYGKILKKNKKFCLEIPIKMNYPSKTNYTKIKPFIDWYIMAKYWVKGYFDRNEL